MSNTKILPDNVRTALVTESAAAQSWHTTEANSNIAHTNNLLRTKTIAGLNTLDPVTARSIDKILDQPSS